MLDRAPSLTDQVKTHLKRRIVSGEFGDGRIPAEIDLAEGLGVSRTTVRDALSRLEQEGAIYRKQGAGTFVNRPGLQIKSRLEEMWSYEAVLTDHGYTPSARVLDVGTEPADAAVADSLGIGEGTDLFVMEKLFLEDATPVVSTINRIPAAYLHDEVAANDVEPLYLLLEAHSDRRLAYYLSEIVPVALEGEQATRLEVDPGTPAISFEEIGFDQDNIPVVQATSYFRDDLLRLRLIRRKSGS